METMLKIAVQMDPVAAVNIDADTTFMLAMEAQDRGHRLWFHGPQNLALEDGVLWVRAQRQGDHGSAERAALRCALLDPEDHRPWLDVAAAREAQGALSGALETLARAHALDGSAAVRADAVRKRVLLRLN